MKVFIPFPIAPFRRQTFPLLKPFYTKEGIRKITGEIPFDGLISFTESEEECNLMILPMSWNYYKEHGHYRKVVDIINNSTKPVLSFVTGDYGVQVPSIKNVKVLRTNGHRSKHTSNHIGLPPFIADPIQKYYHTNDITTVPYQEEPLIGFCGMANTSLAYALEELMRIARRNIKFYMGISASLPQEILPTTFRRAQLLEKLRKSKKINTQFIYRKSYQGGALTEADKMKITQEFYDNIKESQYILCFRGAGNFSIRFYETLAMGRIPIFVNTDCILPLADVIDWKQHVVWIEYHERHRIVEKVLEFHHRYNASTFEALQLRNRKLWEEKLTLTGFFKSLLHAI
jgi:Exostosin family